MSDISHAAVVGGKPPSRLWYLAAVLTVLAGFVGGACASAQAEEPGAECESAGSNVQIKNCLATAYQNADRELNAVWPQVLASVEANDYLTPAQRAAWKKELRESQRAWVQFKEHDCNGAVLYEWWGGSGAGGAISSCLLAHTVARTKDLRQRYLEQR